MANISLPQQIILDIVYFCDIPTLKCLRLANRSIRDLIDTYQGSICSNAMNQFFEEEETDLFQLLDEPSSAIRALFALEYRVRMAKWLAAVGMENIHEDMYLCHAGVFGNIGADEAQGDSIRSYVTIGWSVLWRLADIARQVIDSTSEGKASDSKTRITSLTRGLSSIQEIEMTIRDCQLEYIDALAESGRETFGFYCMHWVVAAVFMDRVFDDPRGRASDWRTGNEYGLRNSWLNWFVLREGPGFFARAWASQEGNEECSRLITKEWSERSKTQLLREFSSAKEVEEKLLSASHGNEGLRYLKLRDWARAGREFERIFPDVTYHLGRRLPADVVRSIEEDYSDYTS